MGFSVAVRAAEQPAGLRLGLYRAGEHEAGEDEREDLAASQHVYRECGDWKG
jgi:hypothetical protein